MRTEDDELLSAFVDGEISRFHARRCCEGLLAKPEHLSRWARYHLIRNALRHDLPPRVDASFARRVMAQVQAEALPRPALQGSQRAKLIRPLVGTALAASMAVISGLGLYRWVATGPQAPVPGTTTVAGFNPLVEEGPLERTTVEALALPPVNPETATILKTYLVNHAQHAASADMLPYVRVVSYTTDSK